jgi:hypothetical protein
LTSVTDAASISAKEAAIRSRKHEVPHRYRADDVAPSAAAL